MTIQDIISVLLVIVSSHSCVYGAESAVKLFALTEQGQKLNHVISTVTTHSMSTCCLECSMEDTCVAVSYRIQDGMCNLNDRNPFDFPHFSSTFDISWTTFGREAKCPGTGWLSYNRACYKVVAESMNWHEARDNCEAIGGLLVDILDDAENQFVYEAVLEEAQRQGSATSRYWIGLHLISDRVHGWVSGAPFVYENFKPGEPNFVYGGEREDCVSERSAGEWNDLSCYRLRSFSVCEKSLY